MVGIKVLGICGSPRKGNSMYLLEHAMEAAKVSSPETVETEIYSFRGKTFNPCLGCNKCAEQNGQCVHKDDFEELRGKWMNADAIIYSVPVYHMTYPGQLKCFIDRLGNSGFGIFLPYWAAGKEFDSLPKLYKVIGSIAQGIHIFSGQEHTITDFINHALLMQCIPVPGDMWEAYIGVGAWTSNDIDRHALEKQVAAGNWDSSLAVKSSKAMGHRVAQMATIVKSGILANRPTLELEPLHRPIFNWLDGKGWAEKVPWEIKA